LLYYCACVVDVGSVRRFLFYQCVKKQETYTPVRWLSAARTCFMHAGLLRQATVQHAHVTACVVSHAKMNVHTIRLMIRCLVLQDDKALHHQPDGVHFHCDWSYVVGPWHVGGSAALRICRIRVLLLWWQYLHIGSQVTLAFSAASGSAAFG
jgi:hypothetical protein